MINSVKAGVSADPSLHQRDRGQGRRPSDKEEDGHDRAEEAAPSDHDLRLVIERDERTQDYVYRLIDKATGKLVKELPRHQVDRLASAPSYAAGSVVNTKA